MNVYAGNSVIALTAVALFAVTHDLIAGVVHFTRKRVEALGVGVTGAGAGPAVLPRSEHRVSKERIHTTGTK